MSKIKAPGDLMSDEDSLSASKMVPSICVLTMADRGLFYKGTNSIHVLLSSS
jgi:hypothetical protein